MTFVIAEAERHFLKVSDVNIREISGVNSKIKLRRMFIKKWGLLNKEENDVHVTFMSYVFTHFHEAMIRQHPRLPGLTIFWTY